MSVAVSSSLVRPEAVPHGMPAHMTLLPDWLHPYASLLAGETSMDYLARHSHSFRYASRFLPPPYDTLVADVYAFCRFTDDLVDGSSAESPSVLRARLEEWRSLARLAWHGTRTGLPLLDRPLGEMGRRGIPLSYAAELIDGVGMDLELRRFATLEELEVYSHRVASVVGLWLTELVGVRDRAVLARAADLGHAMQLTNILRDVGEDWARGRLYLPLDVLARHGIREEDVDRAVREGDIPKAWRPAMEELMAVAEQRYASALGAIPDLPGFFRKPVMVSALVYRDIHTAIRRNGHDNLRRRAHTSLSRKVWLGLKARTLLGLGVRGSKESVTACAMESASTSMGRIVNDRAKADGREAAQPLQAQSPGHKSASLAVVLAFSAGALVAGENVPFHTAAPESARLPVWQDVWKNDSESVARRRLAVTEAALVERPGSLQLRLERLRLLHALSVQDESLLAKAREARVEAEKVARTAPDAGKWASVLLAYRGALEVVEARHAFWPRARMEPLRRGLPLLDTAVRRNPGNAEIRYLRLTSSYYLPFFLGRKWSVREDFSALAELLPSVRGEFPAEWYVAIADFVLENGEIDKRDRERLRRARAEAAETGGLSNTGRARPDYSRIP
jgi:phytoene synthase